MRDLYLENMLATAAYFNWSLGTSVDLLLASLLVFYQLKFPELHCLICTSCDDPPLQESKDMAK